MVFGDVVMALVVVMWLLVCGSVEALLVVGMESVKLCVREKSEAPFVVVVKIADELKLGLDVALVI